MQCVDTVCSRGKKNSVWFGCWKKADNPFQFSIKISTWKLTTKVWHKFQCWGKMNLSTNQRKNPSATNGKIKPNQWRPKTFCSFFFSTHSARCPDFLINCEKVVQKNNENLPLIWQSWTDLKNIPGRKRQLQEKSKADRKEENKKIGCKPRTTCPFLCDKILLDASSLFFTFSLLQNSFQKLRRPIA